MGKHEMEKPNLLRRIFFKTWEVRSHIYTDIDRFRTRKGAQVFADEMNNPNLYEPGTFDNAQYTINRRSFKKEKKHDY